MRVILLGAAAAAMCSSAADAQDSRLVEACKAWIDPTALQLPPGVPAPTIEMTAQQVHRHVTVDVMMTVTAEGKSLRIAHRLDCYFRDTTSEVPELEAAATDGKPEPQMQVDGINQAIWDHFTRKASPSQK